MRPVAGALRDLEPGTHALRLDTLGLPRGAHLARARDELVIVEQDGWTTPQVNFRLVAVDTVSVFTDAFSAVAQARFTSTLARPGVASTAV